MKNAIIFLCPFILCVGIIPIITFLRKPFNIIEENKQSLLGDGEFIGTLKDGRKLIRYEIINHPYHVDSHWIYVIDSSVSSNYIVRSGKNTSNETAVLLD